MAKTQKHLPNRQSRVVWPRPTRLGETAVPVGQANRRRASGSLDDVPHRLRLPCYPPVGPCDRLPDLYGSLSTLLGITPRRTRPRWKSRHENPDFRPTRQWSVAGEHAKVTKS